MLVPAAAMLEMAWATALTTGYQLNKGRVALCDITISAPLVLSVQSNPLLRTTVNYLTGHIDFLSDAALGNKLHMSATSGELLTAFVGHAI